MTDDAEKEASEVLHSLLSVERIENKFNLNSTNNSTVQFHLPVEDNLIFLVDDETGHLSTVDGTVVSY